MDWTPGGLSSDIEDRRSDSGGGGGGFGFGGGGGGLGGGIGIVGFIILVVLSLVTGHNFLGSMFGGGSSGAPSRQVQTTDEYGPQNGGSQNGGSQNGVAGTDRDAQLISVVLDDVQKRWTDIFAQEGKQYRHAKLVLFRGSTYSGCGTAQAATGPFYCPEDQKVYIDLGFWDELKRFGGSTADFAQAYVIAHEMGHHVQNLLGTEQRVTRLERQDPSERNHLSIDLELQADCYAGVWANHAREHFKLNDEDLKDALSAAASVGDDHLQQMSGRAVSPETWTHGSSQQREHWFQEGFNTGEPASCDTFAGQ